MSWANVGVILLALIVVAVLAVTVDPLDGTSVSVAVRRLLRALGA